MQAVSCVYSPYLVVIASILAFYQSVMQKRNPHAFSKHEDSLAPQVGLEPTTLRLTAECSAIELLRNIKCGSDLFFRAVTSQVSSTYWSLTSVFGMETGGTSRLLPPQWVNFFVRDFHPTQALSLRPDNCI